MAFYHRKLMPEPDYNNTPTDSIQICMCVSNKGSDDAITCPSYCSPPPPLPPPPPPSTPYLLPSNHPKITLPLKISLIVLGITFSLFLLYTLYKFYTVWHRSRQQRPQSEPDQDQETTDDFLDLDHGPVVDHPIWYIRTIGLNPSVISAITIVQYKKSEGLVEGTDCSVCLSEFQENETLRLLPKCNHAFHVPCIDTWLRSHTNCPLCRAGIVKNTANSPATEQDVVENSIPTEETRVGNSENDGGIGRESEDEGSEVRIGIEEDDVGISIPKAEVGIIELVLMRRSVSLDSSAASRVSAIVNAAIANNAVQSDQTDFGIAPKRVNGDQSLLRIEGSSSIGRSLQRGPDFMRRSFSCSGKVLLSRHSSRESSVPPPS